jgi:hypothetical protein
MKDLGEAKVILGCEVERNRHDRTILLHQHAYVVRKLEAFRMDQCRPAGTPGDPSVTLSSSMSPQTDEQKAEMKDTPYAQATGALLYLAQVTRPDIAAAVAKVCRYNHNPGPAHWTAVKHIFRYLKGTSTHGILLGGPTLCLEGYADSDDNGDPDTSRSTSGYVFRFGLGTISWRSSLQKSVTLSSMESEYVAFTIAAQELMWLRDFLNDMGLLDLASPTPLHEDNKSCIDYVHNGKYSSKSKHINRRYHFVRELVADNTISMLHCPSESNLADIMTKNLKAPLFKQHRTSLQLVPSTLIKSSH